MDSLVFVGIGEVLFDIFEDGSETLGGAPLNFAVHIHQLAGQLGIGQGIVVSSVSFDARGHKIINTLENRHMPTRYIERDADHPSGLVNVFMQNGEPGYQIEADSAWDHITEKPELKELASHCSAVCFGSLAQRSSVSRDTIRHFLAESPPRAIRLYDANLRRNTVTGEAGYSEEILDYSCRAATIIKVNQSELSTISDMLEMPRTAGHSLEDIRKRMGAFLTRFPAKAIIVTRGDKGTLFLNRNGQFDLADPSPTRGTPHPVGAGDACSAGIVFGLSLGWDIHTTMELANRMGADVAAHPSATPPLSEETLHFARAKIAFQGKMN